MKKTCGIVSIIAWLILFNSFKVVTVQAEVFDMQAQNQVQAAPCIGNPNGKIQTFNLKDVELLPGRLYDQFHQVMQFYMKLRYNDILKPFREKTQKNPPGKELGGAFGASQFGQWLSGFSRMYSVTGDEAIKEKTIYLMDEWAKTLKKGEKFDFGRPYTYDKLVGGLVDVYEYIGQERAIEYLNMITDWAEENIDRSNRYAQPSEWYTLPENLYRAYELTGDKRYYNFAKVWEYTDFWNILSRNESPFQEILKTNPKHESYHAYSHVNCLSSAAMAYKVTGQKHYLDTIVNGYNFLKNTQLYATGGYGPEEQFVVPDGLPETLVGVRRGQSDVNVRFHFETSCGSWAGFKLSRYLQTFTGQAQYGDWIEKLIYNGVGAMIPMNDFGMIMYGSKYHLYGAQKSLFTVWFCCQGSLPETVTEYHNLIYYHDKQNLYVNLFVPSKVKWNSPDGPVTVIQDTTFPETDSVNIVIQSQEPRQFGLKFRVPLWTQGDIKVKFNGSNLPVSTKAGTWAVIDKLWHDGDIVTLTFDLSPRAVPIAGCISPVAVMCGPAVMVRSTARTEENSEPSQGPLRFPSDWIMGEDPMLPYSFTESMKLNVNRSARLHTNQAIRPFYDIKAGEYYKMYFEKAGEEILPTDKIEFDGNWNTEGLMHYAYSQGSSFKAEFNGTSLVWEGLRQNNAGIADIYIDGKKITTADQYGYTDTHVGRLDQRQVPFRWSIVNLPGGKHTIKVEASSDKNPLSKGSSINVTRLIAYP